MAQGHTSGEIADILQVSLDTVRGHTRQLMRGLGARTTSEAVEVARRLRTGG
jgi:DNA-binding CsgD family transcriptional regulator